ncbi:MAG TPA: ATP-binding protein [Bryobacteraceae bacterium]|nr:ATP-binding protein [Bryobacteraceae bacterium]
MEIPLPQDEALRLEALRRYAILDTPPDPGFDRITRLAAKLLHVPISLISLVAEDRQWFKSCVGLDIQETPRAVAFCSHTILQDDPLVVKDATADPRFAQNPLVTGSESLRFYAGAPLKSRDGYNLGTLSVLDRTPREPTADELELLQDLAGMVVNELELRLALIELQRVERERQRGESLRDAVFANANLGICITDQEGVFMEVNPAYCRIFGYKDDELLGKPFTFLLQPKDLRRARIIHDAFFKRWTSSEGEWEATRRDGTTISVYLTANRFNANGGNALAVTTVTDLTRVKRMERELRQFEKLDAIGRVAGGMAHDFNNLLTVILGYAHVLQHQVEGPESQTSIREILSAAERAAAITSQLLACSRQQPFETELLDLNLIVSDLASVIQPLLGESIRLVVEPHSPLALIRADRKQIEQVILNLAVNARDAMVGGGVLTIRTGTKEIPPDGRSERKTPPGRYTTLTVSDTGIGMNDAVRARLFEPFFTTKSAAKGAGFGLATVYGIVRRFGGSIVVESRPGEGSQFSIYLPQAPVGVFKKDTGHAGQVAGGLKVLVVDDEPAVRKMLAAMLTSRGHSVFTAGTAAEALRIGEHHRVDLLVADAVMPDMSGPQLAAELVRTKRVARVVFISGYPKAEKTMELPGVPVAWLDKPFTVEHLVDTINRLFLEDAA